MPRHCPRSQLFLILLVFFFALPVGCGKSASPNHTNDLEQRMKELEAKVNHLQKGQEAIIENQRQYQEELKKSQGQLATDEARLKKAQEQAQQGEPVETPTEKVRRAIKDIRSIATAVQAYATDQNLFPEMGSNMPFTLQGLRLCRALDVAGQLSPDYIRFFPAWDPWGSPYLYWAPQGRNHFLIVCMGADGRIDSTDRAGEIMKTIQQQGYTRAPINVPCLGADIVWYDDGFIQLPEGPLKDCK